MSDDRRFTTDRFYGGVSHRLQNLRSMLQYVRDESPSREQLSEWVIRNTQAESKDAVNHHLAFLESIEIVRLSDSVCVLGKYGQRWLNDDDPETLYDALSSGVRGFDIVLEGLRDEPMTDGEIMELLVDRFDEMEMTTPGPAIRHREWLQVLGMVERRDGVNRITARGKRIVEDDAGDNQNQPPSGPTYPDPDGITPGESVTQEEIEQAFDTGFGYRISGINPRRDSQDRRYVLVFATEEGPYDDDVTRGQFNYIGEGLTGDQSETSPGNSTLIDAIDGGIPVHFFYQATSGGKWEYQGLVDVLRYEFVERDGREVLEFTLQHRKPDRHETDVEKTTILDSRSGDPQLTEDEERFVDTRRRARDTEFAEMVREAYDRTCAVCGSRRETPTGDPEVEAAHIYPKSEGGADDVRNGVALCRLHHWAFDTGWLAFTDDHEILVKDVPEREGYYEFKQLEGNSLVLPEEGGVEPHPTYLQEHRELHGF
jgi:putative restriction endonuclease